jgi:hypothetical protein
MNISDLEKELTALNTRASNAKIELMRVTAWNIKYEERNGHAHPQKWQTLSSLREREQQAEQDFYRVAQALERAREQLYKLTQQQEIET